MKKVKIFLYTSAKNYLFDLFELNKKSSNISIKEFSMTLGFNSHSFMIDIFKKKKFLSEQSIEKISENLKFKVKEKKYFLLISEYDRELSPKIKQDILYKLLELRLKSTSSPMTSKQINYYMKWYNPIIRELVSHSNWKGDFKKLSSLVIPKIKEKEAIESVELLLELNLISKKDGIYNQTENNIFATEELKHPALYWVKEMISKGIGAIDIFSKEKRYITTTTASLTKEKYTKIQEYFDKINALVLEEDDGEEQVYQVGLQMFPVSASFNGDQQ